MVRRYIPEVGDIVWLHFDPQAGHEQAGHRPALILSPSLYNGKTSLMLGCRNKSICSSYVYPAFWLPILSKKAWRFLRTV